MTPHAAEAPARSPLVPCAPGAAGVKGQVETSRSPDIYLSHTLLCTDTGCGEAIASL